MPMGLVDELGYEPGPPSAGQRAVQRLASTRAGAAVLSRTLHHADRALFSVSRGRWSLPGILAGVPSIVLSTVGAKSGVSRLVPLLGIPFEGDLAVIGSNWGRRATPGWVCNLEADPVATVTFKAKTVTVTARRADPAETERIFGVASSLYPGYARYRARARHRAIRVFILRVS